MAMAVAKGRRVLRRRDVYLIDRTSFDRAVPLDAYRMFFDNPDNNTRNRTRGQTNLTQPGEVPARSWVDLKALAIYVTPARSGTDNPLDSRDIAQTMSDAIVELEIGQSGDPRLSLFAGDVLRCKAVPQAIGGVTEGLGLQVGRRDPKVGQLYSLKGDAIRIAALQTFQLRLRFPGGVPAFAGDQVGVFTGIIFGDVGGDLAQQYGRYT